MTGVTDGTFDFISPAQAATLPALFRERVRRTPDGSAYRYFDEGSGEWRESTWSEVAREVARWQAGFADEGIEPGDRVAVLLRNCREWVVFDQAALASGLVVVPLYTDDRAENIAYILKDAGAKVLLLEAEEHWERVRSILDELPQLQRVLTVKRIEVAGDEARVRAVADWLPDGHHELQAGEGPAQELATIVYTSGTTGHPKGVMLSHNNIVWNAYRALDIVPMYRDDILLSFLPLSHTFERTAGYYLPMMSGATVAYARSIPQLAEDLMFIRPTLLISVPRIFERVFNRVQMQLAERPPLARKLFWWTVETGWRRFLYQQGRTSWHPTLLSWPLLNRMVAYKIISRMGGRMRLAASGGAPLPPSIARVFIGLGLPIIQGYGLTETSPIIAGNPIHDNEPASVGVPLKDVEIRVGEKDELLVRSPGVMLGYWNNPQATRNVIDEEGWFHTGDKVRIERNHIYITGRLKEILVLAIGEKVPPADMEMTLAMDPLFDQVMIIGDRRPFVTALIVLNREQWNDFAQTLDRDPRDPATLDSDAVQQALRNRCAGLLTAYPGYAQVRAVTCTLEPWNVDNGLLTPTMKLRRSRIMEHFSDAIEKMYAGH
jgi:long-chain acyl-CoA synthetase